MVLFACEHDRTYVWMYMHTYIFIAYRFDLPLWARYHGGVMFCCRFPSIKVQVAGVSEVRLYGLLNGRSISLQLVMRKYESSAVSRFESHIELFV